MIDSSLWLLVGYALGIILGWIIWSPDTRFKKSFLEGLTLQFLWKR
jgi:hypothetical protein